MTRFHMATTAVFGALMLGLPTGCGANQSQTVESLQATPKMTTMQDLESQLLRQFCEQWPTEELSHVRIDEFSHPQMGAAVRMIISIGWAMHAQDTHIRSLGTGLSLYRAADDYLVGTVSVEGRTPLNVILKLD